MQTNMLLTLFLFIIGFVFLVKGADYLIAGSSSIARRFGISSLVIGLTVVAFGTSAPEFVVSVIASWQGDTDIAIGNVLGSNIANIMLILGAAAFIYPITVKDSTVWKEIPFSLLAVGALYFMANDAILGNGGNSELSRGDGLTLLLFFLIFLVYVFGISKKGILFDPSLDHEHVKVLPTWKSGALVIIGLVGLSLGGKWIVDGAIYFATSLGLSEALIGLTIVAIGTSLPEFAASIAAAYKKEPDIVIGNVVGSNIFNIFWVLSASSLIRPLSFSEALNQDIMMAIMATLLLFVFIIRDGENKSVQKWEGAFFILIYIGYVSYLVIRG